MLMTFPKDRQPQVFGQGIDDRNADAMQSTGNLVTVVVELAACMQDGHDDFGRGTSFLVHANRDSAAIVDNTDRTVSVDRHRNLVGMTSQGFVDRVVDDLEDHVVQTGTIIGVADVHAGALAHGFKAFENLDFA